MPEISIIQSKGEGFANVVPSVIRIELGSPNQDQEQDRQQTGLSICFICFLTHYRMLQPNVATICLLHVCYLIIIKIKKRATWSLKVIGKILHNQITSQLSQIFEEFSHDSEAWKYTKWFANSEIFLLIFAFLQQSTETT